MKYFIIAMGIMCLPGLILILDLVKTQHKGYLKKKERKVYYIDCMKKYK
jgi:hypothetical protein